MKEWLSSQQAYGLQGTQSFFIFRTRWACISHFLTISFFRSSFDFFSEFLCGGGQKIAPYCFLNRGLFLILTVCVIVNRNVF